MSGVGTLASTAAAVWLVRSAVATQRPTSFSVLDVEVADYLDLQGHVVLIRRAGPSEYVVIPRMWVKK